MPISAKQWLDRFGSGTPLAAPDEASQTKLDAAALRDLEARLGAYVDRSGITRRGLFMPGSWYGPTTTAESAGGPATLDLIRAYPLEVPVAVTFDQVGVNHFATVGSAGTGLRVMVYSDDGLGPDVLLADAGVIPLDTATNRKQLPLNLAVAGGSIIWVATVGTGAGATRANVARVVNAPATNAWALPQGQSANFTVRSDGFQRAVAGSGAAPPAELNPVRADLEAATDIHYVWLRAA